MNFRIRQAPFLIVLMLACTWSGVQGANDQENFKWQEAALFVDSLPYKPAFIDSLKRAYQMSFPLTPLRKIVRPKYSAGEMLVYDIGWGPFKAGYVILTATPDTAAKTIKLGGKALSNGFVSSFYRMRDYVISTIDADGLYPLFFEQHLREGKRYKSDGWILYDHYKKSIYVKERKIKSFEAPPFTNDYLSVLYLARTKKFGPGDTFSLPLYADSKIHSIFFYCKGREAVHLDTTKIMCLIVEPKLVSNKGAFNKRDQLLVWLSDDDAKTPIQIKSKINIGSITAKLVASSTTGKANVQKKGPVDSVSMQKPANQAELTKIRDTVIKRDTVVSTDTLLGKKPDSAILKLRSHDSIKTEAAQKDTGKADTANTTMTLPVGKDLAPK